MLFLFCFKFHTISSCKYEDIHNKGSRASIVFLDIENFTFGGTMEETNEDIIKYRFTSYILVALQRAKKDYIRREIEINGHESLSAELCLEPLVDSSDSSLFLWEEAEYIPLKPKAVREYMDSQVDEAGKAALDTLTETEVLVVYMKIFRQMTYAEIGNRLDMDWKKAGSIYTYARKKMQKGWKR